MQILASPVARKQLLLFGLIDRKAERAIDERRQLRKVAHDLITRRQPCRNVRIFSDIEVRPSWFSGFSEASATGEAMLIGVETRRKSTMAAFCGSGSKQISNCQPLSRFRHDAGNALDRHYPRGSKALPGGSQRGFPLEIIAGVFA